MQQFNAPKLTRERIESLFSYCPHSGQFTRRVARGNAPVGAVAGTLTSHGYIQISIDGKVYYAHRLAWFLHHNEWVMIDHRDGARTNNAIANLRPATYTQNAHNKKSVTGRLKGTYLNRRINRWVAEIKPNGVKLYLGSFKTEEEAHRAYMLKARELFGEFARAA